MAGDPFCSIHGFGPCRCAEFAGVVTSPLAPDVIRPSDAELNQQAIIHHFDLLFARLDVIEERLGIKADEGD